MAVPINHIKLGRFQSPITPGFPVNGGAHSVVLIAAATQLAGVTRGQGPLFYIAGSVVGNRRDKVVTAWHCLTFVMKAVNGGVRGPIQVWAMPARQFHFLGQGDKANLYRLRQLGAVRATEYCSFAANLGIFDNEKLSPAKDSALVELAGPLNMPANQPLILSAAQVANFAAWLRNQHAHAMVNIVVEGMSVFITPRGAMERDAALRVSTNLLRAYTTQTLPIMSGGL